ncbi:MAG: VOC family protein [Akkermansiaceae bacterium]|nr:VOC family protein [Armatimonadota bacterium]
MQTTLHNDSDRDGPPLRVRELNHIAIHVRDLAESKRFYGETLGLPLLPRPDFGFDGAWYALGTQELHLIIDTEHRDDPRHSVHLALLVGDAVAAHTELERRGVSIVSKPNPRPDGAVQVFFRDPDGYLIEMVSRARE